MFRARSAAAALVAGVLALTLAGCAGGGTSTPTASSSHSPNARSASNSGTFPATVDTLFGKVIVKAKPDRVVALGWGDAEAALALGVQPVGASDWLGFGGDGVGPWAKGLYTKPPVIIGTLEPSYEKIAALKPDLILDTKSSGDKARYTQLSLIAPTIDVPKGGRDYLTSTTQQMTMIATALGRPAAGAKLLAGAKQRLDHVANEHPAWKGKTATVAAYTSQGWGAYVDGDTRLAFLQSLGFVQNPTIAKQRATNFFVPISSEKLDLLNADLLVTFPIFIDPKKITDQPLYRAISAVKNGHAILIDDKTVSNAFSIGSVLAQKYLVRKFVPEIAKAVG